MPYHRIAPYAGVLCPIHGAVDIDKDEYMRQMSNPNARWACPICRSVSEFDEERYEELNPEISNESE